MNLIPEDNKHANCVKNWRWPGTPTGRVEPLLSTQTYIAGTNPDVCLLIIHDLMGWSSTNMRLLADYFAAALNITVHLPDFFGGESLPDEPLHGARFDEVDVFGFLGRNTREIREAEIFAAARELRSRYKKLGAAGYCFGAWAVLRLGAAGNEPAIVDAVMASQPTFVTERDLDEVGVPFQMQAPEIDRMYTKEMKAYTFKACLERGVPFEYLHFPGVEHGCLSRGDPNDKKVAEAIARGKAAAVTWFKLYLLDQ